MTFADRTAAGTQLAGELAHLHDADVVILALPRGGAPVALQVALALDAPLEVVGVRKLGAPNRPEFGIGAVAENGVRVVDEASVRMLGLTDEDLDALVERERGEIRRRIARYRGDRDLPDLADRTVVVIDDGLATGVTAEAALRAVRHMGPARLILAVPVGPRETIERLRKVADEVVVLTVPEPFMAVGAWYADFDQTTDEEVLDALDRARATPRESTGPGSG